MKLKFGFGIALLTAAILLIPRTTSAQSKREADGARLLRGAVDVHFHMDAMTPSGGSVQADIATVRVARDEDPERIREILIRCCKAHPGIAHEPEPWVLLTQFGDWTLDFDAALEDGTSALYTTPVTFAPGPCLLFALDERGVPSPGVVVTLE